MNTINVANDFSDTLGGRYKKQSKFSGEAFREEILEPKLKNTIKKGKIIEINLDGTYGYPTSFLDEAFGKLVKKFSQDEIELIKFISNDEPSLVEVIYKYMENNRNAKK